MKRFLTVLAVFYALGIILAGWSRLNFWMITALALAILLLAKTVKEGPLFFTLALGLALLAGYLNLENSYKLSACHLRRLVAYKSDFVYQVDGFVVRAPEFRNNRYWFILRAREVQVDRLKYKCCGGILVKMDFPQDLEYGDNLTLVGPINYLPLRRSGNFLASQGIYLTLSLKNPRQLIRRAGCGGIKIVRCCLRLRAYLEKIIKQHLADLPASIILAMVLGQKRDLPWQVTNTMVESGTVHILVVSGFNVGIVAFMVNLLFKILRLLRRVRIILTGLSLVIYCLVTGSSNPVIRATIMGLVFLAAYFLKREPDIYNSLAASGLFILVISPAQLFDLGFQLSFMSVLAIVYLYPKFETLFCLRECKIKTLKFIGQGFWVSFSAWLGTFLIVAWNFRIFTPVTVLANILIVPLAAGITLCGFTLVLSGTIYPDLAALISLPTSMLVNLLLNLNNFLVKLPLACIYL